MDICSGVDMCGWLSKWTCVWMYGRMCMCVVGWIDG